MAQVTVKHNFIHQAPRKLRLISDTIRGLPTASAVSELSTLSQTASTAVRKAILAGIAAAKEQGLDTGVLYVQTIMVNEGPKMRRFIPLSRGRSARILKRMSHLIVTLTDEATVTPNSKAYKRELAATNKKVKSTKKTETVAPAATPEVAATEAAPAEGKE